jgi:hypothetical protein
MKLDTLDSFFLLCVGVAFLIHPQDGWWIRLLFAFALLS